MSATTPELHRDRRGDLRTQKEATWPIKARCIRCHGTRDVRACGRCQGRGYYFLPLGD